MNRITYHDILGTVEGLQSYAKALQNCASQNLREFNAEEKGVLADPEALRVISNWMAEAAEELKNLIPNEPVKILPSDRRWRTLVRVVAYDEKAEKATVVLPGWNPEESLVVEIPQVHPAVFRKANPSEEVPLRLYAWVNIGAGTASELVFSDWEI